MQMTAPRIPANETHRLEALRDLEVLDTGTEDRFDRLTRLAGRLFEVPIAALSLVDENREWFKTCVGVEGQEGARAVSFCGHTILEDDTLVIPDAAADPRFADNPQVTGDGIRFYAGHPLWARTRVGFRIVELQQALAARVSELEVALSQVKQLQGLLPICAYCKKVRDDGNYWHQVESYITDHTDAKFSHGICPECLEGVKRELDEQQRKGASS